MTLPRRSTAVLGHTANGRLTRRRVGLGVLVGVGTMTVLSGPGLAQAAGPATTRRSRSAAPCRAP